VLHLAEILTQSGLPEEVSIDIHLAALLHDVGTPPFSHGSELLLERLIGKDHEAFAENILYASELDELIRQAGGVTDRIASFIRGEALPYGSFVAGAIDVDNLDNTLRFGTSMGLLHESLYAPEVLARGMFVKDGEVALKLVDMDPLNRWEQCRRLVYQYVNGEDNLKPAMMLYRAMVLAYESDELSIDFFMMKDDEAYEFLMEKTNKLSQKIMRRLDAWDWYECVFDYKTESPSEKLMQLALDAEHWDRISDELAGELKIPREDVSVRIRKDKGSKKLTLPIYDLHGNTLEFESKYSSQWMVQVFVAKEHNFVREKVEEYMTHKTGL
jgi:HD superfamily phosphohydrolase